MRQQTIYAINQYMQLAHKRYVLTQDIEEALDIVTHANNLVPLVEAMGLAEDY